MLIETQRTVAAIVAVLMLFASVGLGQGLPAAVETPAAAQAPNAQVAEMWSGLVHAIRVGRAEMALGYAQGILNSGASSRDVYLLATQTDGWQGLLSRGAKLEGLAEPIGKIREMIEQGFEGERSDPKQITTAIDMLTQGVRSYELGAKRLEVSGEYAMPQLVARLMDPATTPVLRERIINVLPRMGNAAVRPLSAALETDDTNLQVIFANALGQIGYAHSAPALKALTIDANAGDKARQAAQKALVAVAGQVALEKSLAEVAYEQAQRYYDGYDSLLPDSRYETANVWYWRPGLGLDYRPVPRVIFNDIYAMRLAKMALKSDPKFYPALSLWVAADLRKEALQPAGTTDPTMAQDQPTAEFYALASSASALQDVLARALKDNTPAVALGAIKALANTAGAKNLAKAGAGGLSPLVKALESPDRHVRFLAAVTLANALPDAPFEGSDMVVSTLSDALRQTGQKTAMIIASDENANVIRDTLAGAGYNVLQEADVDKAIATGRASAGVDLVVVSLQPSPAGVVSTLRATPQFAITPVIIAADSQKYVKLAEADKQIVLADGPTAEGITAAAQRAERCSIGAPMTQEAAIDWAIRAAQSIELLGLTNNCAFEIGRTIPALCANLSSSNTDIRLSAAKALSTLPQDQAQQSLAAFALDGQVEQKIRVEAFGNLSRSLRKIGNKLTREQSQAVLELVTNPQTPSELRNAAAQSLGAMDLPSELTSDLIVKTAGQ